MSRFVLLFSRLLNLFPPRFILFVGDLLGLFWFEFSVSDARWSWTIFNGPLGMSSRRKRFRNSRCATSPIGRSLLEVLQSLSWTKETCRERVEVEGLENVMSWVAQGRGGYLLTCHLGNWELAVESAIAYGVPLDIISKRVGNPKADALCFLA